MDDHNLYESNGNNISHLIQHSSWGGSNDGHGSWADYPYYGSDKFWFLEDNTIKGSGSEVTSGGVDSSEGGRYVARHNYVQNTSFGGHGTEGGPARGQRCDQVYNNTFYWTSGHGGHAHRSGSTIWHDNTFLGRDPGNWTTLPYISSGNWAWLAMTCRTGALRTVPTDGTRMILTAYISRNSGDQHNDKWDKWNVYFWNDDDGERLSRDAGTK